MEIPYSQFAPFLEGTDLCVHSLNQDGTLTYVNGGMADALGYPAEELIGRNLTEVLSVDASTDPVGHIAALLSVSRTAALPAALTTREGTKRAGEEHLVALRDDAGQWVGAAAIFIDLTEDRGEAIAALVEREARFRDLFENSLDSICILDQQKNYKEVNRATEILSGYSREELLTMNVVDLVHPDDLEHSRKHFQQLDESGFYKVYEGRILTKAGQTRYVEVNSNVIVRNGVVVGSRDFIRDVTERKKASDAHRELEHQLFLSQRMESVGRLAGGIAHDFNNILTGMMGYAELLRETLPDETTLEGEAAAAILKGADRAADLTRQLLGFARRGKYNPVFLDVNEMVQEVVGLSEKIFEGRITVTFDLASHLPPIEADKSQLDQVFTNLIINAGDAMPQGGELSIRTSHLAAPPSGVALPPVEVGYVMVSVVDSGMGMPDEVKEHIFEPFFSTKANEGTGLGLATVRGIVENHRGAVTVQSAPGAGSSFDIYLPAAQGLASPPVEEEDALTGNGTVLIIDDEDQVRRILSRQLASLGYATEQAATGEEGVALYSKAHDTIDLVIVDMVMPGMDGESTFRALRSVDPGAKVVLISGYSEEGRARRILSEGVVGFLQKPFRRSSLAAVVGKSLGQDEADSLR